VLRIVGWSNRVSGDEQVLFDQDLLKARAAMERAWLEARPVRESP
jgi:hypothetical protein